MRYWWRGKCGGLVGFLVIAALVLGGLGWVSAAVLRLEHEQRQARAEAEQAGKLRLALWQLDSFILSFILPDLSREDGQPYSPSRKWDAGGSQAKVPDWLLLRFRSSASGWQLPRRHPKSTQPAADIVRQRATVLAELKARWGPGQLLALVRERSRETVETDNASVGGNANNDVAQQAFGNDDYTRRQAIQKNIQSDQSQAPFEDRMPVRVSPQAVPLWLSQRGQPERLLLVRLVQIGSRELCQGVVIDWPRLRQLLAAQVTDLPQAQFVPMGEKTPPRPENTLAALPIEVDPGPAAGLSAPGWTPLRIGLAIAWAAVGVALLAAGLGGWSLLDLSERRSRFVSAVTHELRTPLTTLRLYLDMLTSGMVQEEKQKAEYLQTLHAEADRLNRLIGNVLDFSRLENQRPRLETQRVEMAHVLDQLRSTWLTRCHDAGKVLLIDNEAAGLALVTDSQLVQQILGNLIDNACKYSRAAEDRAIRVRARFEDGRVVVNVADDGPGIPARERRGIFRPFRRGRGADETAGGVGLGLALARRWARLLGGRLTLECSREPTGANFRLELPVVVPV